MLYLGIDQHKAQITINLRNERGNVIQQGQVSTDHAEIDELFRPDIGLSQLGRNESSRLHLKGWKCDSPDGAESRGGSRHRQGQSHEGLAQKNQETPWCEDRKGGRHAEVDDDHLAAT